MQEVFLSVPDPQAEGRNFFSQKLIPSTCYYCFPPPSFIPPTLLHFFKFEDHGLFLVPEWRSCTFWSLVVPDGVHFSRYIKSFLRFWPSCFDAEEGVTSHALTGPVSFYMLGLEFSFKGLVEADLGVSSVVLENCLERGCSRCLYFLFSNLYVV